MIRILGDWVGVCDSFCWVFIFDFINECYWKRCCMIIMVGGICCMNEG